MHPTPRWHRLVADSLAQVIDLTADGMIAVRQDLRGHPSEARVTSAANSRLRGPRSSAIIGAR